MATKSVKPEKASKDSKKKEKRPNKVLKFFRDLKSETKKVVWPSKKQVINNTGVVLVFMVVSGLFIWGLDSGFTALVKLIVG